MENILGKTQTDDDRLDKPASASLPKQDWQEPILERFPLNDALTGPILSGHDLSASS